MRRSAQAIAALLTLPLLAAAPPPAAEDCRAWAEEGVHVDPIPLAGIAAGGPVHVEMDAIVAEEVVQIAEQGWMLGGELHLPAEGLAFPAGTNLAPGYAAHRPLCLPLAPEAGADREAGLRYGRGRLACLIDGEGDGAYEQVQMMRTDYAMHVPQARSYRMIALPAPVRLAQNSLGRPDTRRQVLRRIVVGEVRGDNALLRVLYALRDPDGAPESGGWESDGEGGLVYRLTPRPPVPIDRRDYGLART